MIYKKIRYVLSIVFVMVLYFVMAASGDLNRVWASAIDADEDEIYAKVVLHEGIWGEDVKLVQYCLVKAGFLSENIDGVFGNATTQAVTKFQKAAGLTPDGMVGAQTMRALKSYARPKPQKKSDAAPVAPVTKTTPATVELPASSPANVNENKANERKANTNQKQTKSSSKPGKEQPKSIKKQSKKGQEPPNPTGKQTVAGTQPKMADKQSEPVEKTSKRSDTPDLKPAPKPPATTQNTETTNVQKAKTAGGIPATWRSIRLEASAYTRYDDGCTGRTYRGNQLQRGLVAVDPNVIPLGTKLFIPGYGYAIADDTGGGIRGYMIDLAMDSRQEALVFGRRQITAYIIDWHTSM